jgi:MFS family permease
VYSRSVRVAAAGTLTRDVQVIGLVGAAHFLSHFFQLALPLCFPLLRDALGVPYVALGFLMTLFYGASGIGQTLAGFAVDRFGAPRILVGGLALVGAAIALAGLAPSYWALMPVAVLAGLGNSVFHPADYSIINALVDGNRIGRAYSVHSISGNLGWVLSTLVVVALISTWGWRVALVSVGVAGVAAAALLATQCRVLVERDGPARGGVYHGGGLIANAQMLFSPPMLAAFAYFALLATALVGVKTFAVTAMVAMYAVPLSLATGALTAYLLGNAAGILAGGLIADRTPRHDLVAVAGIVAAAALMLAMASGALIPALLPVVLASSGFFMGITAPSRDMLVRAATPPGASGKVYGFVYSGLDLGSSLAPLLLGWLLDRGEPRAMFVAVSGLLLLTIVTVIQVRRHGARAPARASA